MTASRRFSPTMIAAVIHASIRTQARLANAPMRSRSLVKWISGNHGERQLHAQDHLAQDQQLDTWTFRRRSRW